MQTISKNVTSEFLQEPSHCSSGDQPLLHERVSRAASYRSLNRVFLLVFILHFTDYLVEGIRPHCLCVQQFKRITSDHKQKTDDLSS